MAYSYRRKKRKSSGEKIVSLAQYRKATARQKKILQAAAKVKKTLKRKKRRY